MLIDAQVFYGEDGENSNMDWKKQHVPLFPQTNEYEYEYENNYIYMDF